jgi:hypothetical protein
LSGRFVGGQACSGGPSCDCFGMTISRPNGESPYPGSVNPASSSVPSAPSTARPPLGRPHWVRAISGCWSHQVGRGGSACSPSCPLPHLHDASGAFSHCRRALSGFLVVPRRAALAMHNRCSCCAGPVQQGAVLRWADPAGFFAAAAGGLGLASLRCTFPTQQERARSRGGGLEGGQAPG